MMLTATLLFAALFDGALNPVSLNAWMAGAMLAAVVLTSATGEVLTASAMKSMLKPNGLFIASIRDYDQILVEKPTTQQPAFYSSEGGRRIVHQVWDWIGETHYALNLYITVETANIFLPGASLVKVLVNKGLEMRKR